MPPLADAMDAVHLSVDRFCLLAGVEALAEMMEEDATTVCGARHRRHGDRRGYRWGRTHSEIGYHGGKVKVARPRVRDRAGKEVSLESWQALRDGNLLLEWALNLMVLNVSTRKYHRAVRLPEGDLAKARGDGTSKSAVSRRFVALSRKKMKAWLASNFSELDLLVIQIDGLHVGDHVLMAAIGVDGNGDKHVLAVVEGATENTVVVQALIDNLLARGLDPTLPRLFIVDGAKALSKAIRNTFGVAAAIQRCQVHKGRNIIERLPQHLHASVKKALRQAWDQDDANKAERLLRNARRLEHEEPGVSQHPGGAGRDPHHHPPRPAARTPALACLHQHHRERARHGGQVTRNVKRWRNAEMRDRRRLAGGPEDLPSPHLSSAAHTPKRSPGALSRRQSIGSIASSTSDACPTNFNRASPSWRSRLVELSHLPARRTLAQLGIPRTSFYRWYDRYLTGGPEALEDRRSRPGRVWNRIPDEVRGQIVQLALKETDLSPRELAVRFTDTEGYFVSESSVYRLLKAHDLITSPAFIVVKAADEFKNKTTAPNQLWQTDFTYLKVIGWGWFYLSTVLDDFSRYIIAWKLCTTMKAEDVTDTLELALKASGCDRATVVHKPRLLSDNGSSYIAGDLAEWLDDRDMEHIRGAPYHPQTQGKIERWHQTLKNRILLENYYLPGDLEAQIEAFVGHYNHHRYHESLGNLTPADVYFGRGPTILLKRERIKRQTIEHRRLQYRKTAA